MYIEPNTQVCLQNLEMRRFTRQLKSVLRYVASENCSSWTELATLVRKISGSPSFFAWVGESENEATLVVPVQMI